MTISSIIQVFVYFGVLIALAKPLGAFMARVYEHKPLFGLDRVLGPLERLIYRLGGVRADDEMDWKQYALACVLFSLLSVLADAASARIDALRKADPANTAPVPIELVTASGSGLDPHLSPAAAKYPASRVARARGLSTDQVNTLIDSLTHSPLLGDPTVNVLELNLALDHPPTR